MGSRAINAYEKQMDTVSKWLWFEGAVALTEGQGLCYNSDLGTDTAVDPRRMNRVEIPGAGNVDFFAGVAARDYSAKAGGQLVEVNVPGSVCIALIKAGVSCVVGATGLVCTYTSGNFKAIGAEVGKGTAVALQTITGGGSVLPCLVFLDDGVRAALAVD